MKGSLLPDNPVEVFFNTNEGITMKNVLFASTALVAFAAAGVASAQDSAVTVDWAAEFTLGFYAAENPGLGNNIADEGFYTDGSIGISAAVDLSDSVSASLDWDVLEFDGATGTALANNLPTAAVMFDNGTIEASLTWGDLNDGGASELYYEERRLMRVELENHDSSTSPAVVAELVFGKYSVAAGCELSGTNNGVCQGANFGLGATFGSVDIGVGLDRISAGVQDLGVLAISADATFGAFEVGASYAASIDNANANAAENSIGLKARYDINDAISVMAFYTRNTEVGYENSYGIDVDYTSGAIDLTAYFELRDEAGNGERAFGIDGSYAVTDTLNVLAGVNIDSVWTDTTNYYVGVDYEVNDNITAGLAYNSGDETGDAEYKEGIDAWLSASF
ncbi:MAG: porin [Rhodobacteraceae bacterium]|nr:porin [Paracoccaceae bacterium]